jgi:hypothetical protein
MEGRRTPVRVRGLAVPPLLLTLIEEGRWRHPGEIALSRMMPWFEDPLFFLPDVQAMAKDPADPRVVASDFWTEQGPCSWRQVTPTFSAFVDALDLITGGQPTPLDERRGGRRRGSVTSS